MDYEKAYNEALKKAKGICNVPDQDSVTIARMEYLFPELKESEDERIRKALVRFHKSTIDVDGIKGEDILSWLEKQKSVCEIVERCKNSWYNEGKIAGQFEGITDDEKYQQGWHDALETWKDMRLEVYQQASGNRHEPNYSDNSTKMFSLNDIDEIFENISEKQGEQKATDKVEPKFKVGFWIITKDKNVHKDYSICKIVEIENNRYHLENGDYLDIDTLEQYGYYLWTIDDAKDGDVLVDVYGNIGIFQKNDDFDWSSYCSLGPNGGFRCFAIEHELDGSHPATKEQRDLLFKKIEEAGYQWDAKKKELKLLISNGGDFESPTWSEDDERLLKATINTVLISRNSCEEDDEVKDRFDDELRWLKSLKERLS